MLLSDQDLVRLGPTLVTPFDAQFVQPASIDLRLGRFILAPSGAPTDRVIDIRHSLEWMKYSTFDLETSEYVLYPGQGILASTYERLSVPDNLAARVEGRSTLGRLFILVHHTAGWVEPTFEGEITLEILNNGYHPFTMYWQMPVAQVNFQALTAPVQRAYGAALGSHYQNQTGPTRPVGNRKG